MNLWQLFSGFLVSVAVLSSTSMAFVKGANNDRHIHVALRMIGHEMLLHTGDSLSRVLPVEKEGDRYKVRFESDFGFDPDELVALIGRVVEKTGIAQSYLVEVEECESHQVVYSYEIGGHTMSDLVPCRHRVQPRSCYNMLFTIIDLGIAAPITNSVDGEGADNQASNISGESYWPTFIVAPLLFLAGLFVYYRVKSVRSGASNHMLSLGAYYFDKTNMKLHYGDETIDLTSKESDLLLLLHTSANRTIEREVILNSIWGDEGDYVGRTLDVFISKLRKKLGSDSSLRIVNIRGVGYKLVMC